MNDQYVLDNQEGGMLQEPLQIQMDPKTAAYLEELIKEKHNLNFTLFPHASRFLDEEIQKVKETNRGSKDFRYLDVYRDKPSKVVTKVLVPIREFPKFNFVGKLLGPKGNTFKRLQEETMCKMSILGRGSMRDKQREEELRKGLDPRMAHLSDELHVEISALAPPAEAHARMAYALAEIRKYLLPDMNDEISHQQLIEMGKIQPTTDDTGNFTREEARGSGGGGSRGGGRGGSNSGATTSGYTTTSRQSILGKTRPQFTSEGNEDESYYGGEGQPVYSTGSAMGTRREDESYFDDANNGSGGNKFGRGGGFGVARGKSTRGGGYTSRGAKVGNEGGRPSDDSSQNRWKQPAGSSRFAPRSLPYTRRT